jgi:hypothetical protein
MFQYKAMLKVFKKSEETNLFVIMTTFAVELRNRDEETL